VPYDVDWTIIESVQPNVAIGDLEFDGYPEFVFSSYDGRLHCFSILDALNECSDNWPYNITDVHNEQFIRYSSEPIIVDIDNDGLAEIIVNTWTQIDSKQNGEILIISADAQLLQVVQLPNATASSRTENGALAAPTIGQIQPNTANYELIVMTYNGGVNLYELLDSENAVLQWPTGRGNFHRDGKSPIVGFNGVAWGAMNGNGNTTVYSTTATVTTTDLPTNVPSSAAHTTVNGSYASVPPSNMPTEDATQTSNANIAHKYIVKGVAFILVVLCLLNF
jgi:hypothetical protein